MAGIDDVKAFLAGQGIEVQEFDIKTPTAETAARAVGCSPAEIAKSLLFLVGGAPVMVVTSGDMKVNSSRLKSVSALSGKVKLPNADEVLHYTGYTPGGVSPFLLPDDLPLILDISLQRFETIYPAAGNDYSAVPIDCPTLKNLAGGIWADVSTPLVSA